MTAMTPVVESSGSAVISQTADRWRLNLRVRASSTEAEAAFRRRTRAVTTVQRVLAALPGTVLSGERIEDATDHHSERINAGWFGVVSGEVGDGGRLREIIARLAGVEDVALNGPYWELSASAERSGRTTALAAATSAAQADAATVARALGGRCGPLVRINSGEHGSPIRMERAVMMGESAGPGGDAAPSRTLELDVEPDLIDVHAHVSVTFEFLADG